MFQRPFVLSFLVLLVIGSIWGLTVPLGKIAVSTDHPPLGLTVWQMLFSVLLSAPILWWRGERVGFNSSNIRYFTVIAFIGTLLPNSLFFICAGHLPGGVLAVVYATVPMFALTIALLLGNERFAAHRIFGIVLGVTAMILLAVPDASLPQPEKWPFVLLVAVAALCYGIEGNYIALRAPAGVSPIAVLCGASIIGALIAVPLALITGTWIDLIRTWRTPEWALLGSSAGHVFAYAGYMWLVGFAGVVFSSQVAYIVTIAGMISSMAILGESYSSWVWLAVIMMMGGLMLVQPAGELPATEER